MSATPTEAFDNALKARWGYAPGDPLPWSNMTPKAVYDVARQVLTAPPAAASAGSGEGPAAFVLSPERRTQMQNAVAAIQRWQQRWLEKHGCLGRPTAEEQAILDLWAALAAERSRADAAEANALQQAKYAETYAGECGRLRGLLEAEAPVQGSAIRAMYKHERDEALAAADTLRASLQQAEARAAEANSATDDLNRQVGEAHRTTAAWIEECGKRTEGRKAAEQALADFRESILHDLKEAYGEGDWQYIANLINDLKAPTGEEGGSNV